ncbi:MULTISPECIES: hypothetical protein [unclassified Microcoleus]
MIIIDKNQIIVDINLGIIASSPSEIPIIENLDLNGNNEGLLKMALYPKG